MHIPFLTAALAAVALATAASPPAHGSVIVEASRVIYPASAKDVTLRVTNPDPAPALVQSWIGQRSDSTPDGADVPFALSPAVGRVDPNGSQSVRIVALANDLPRDRETVFYVHVIGIPAKPADGSLNYVQVALRNVIKLFYRPSELTGDANKAHAALSWSVVGKGAHAALQVRNDSPFHVSFANFAALRGGRTVKDVGGGMVAPFSTATFKTPEIAAQLGQHDVALQYGYVDDWGAIRDAPLMLSP